MAEHRRQIAFAYPGDLETPTGGYGYDRRIISGLREAGWQVDLVPLGEGFPFPEVSVLEEAVRRIGAVPVGSPIVIDGLAFGAMGEAADRLAKGRDLIALVHHPLFLENGLPEETADRLRTSEETALEQAWTIIVTSPATAAQVRDCFGIAEDKIHVVLPGTDRAMAEVRPETDCPNLLSVGTIVPRKGYDLLFDALARLGDLSWRLDIVGDTTRDEACFQWLCDRLRENGLEDRVTFHGAVSPEALPDFYGKADIFVLASRYEGYGMAYTEALAHGLPVIGSGGGAVRETLPQGAALYCGVEDVGRLTAALKRLISDRDERKAFAEAARQAAGALPTWQDAVNAFSAVLEDLK
ncbi:glycosyltransferase family 4 protein [Roseibium aggregatum]|uniref:glycosyltransferase family 4 protein n=1 Tax=Roseibium aggregatum TaxID=187304 RepID=UPI001AD8B687|nr:glycosyltransferase family 4 protein [Roseibium aggregatum]